jgi:hypothetical protein
MRVPWKVVVPAIAAAVAVALWAVIFASRRETRGAGLEAVTREVQWLAARACLVGGHPRSTRTSEALSIRELLNEHWDPPECARQLDALARTAEPDSAPLEVRAAARELDLAASAAAATIALKAGSTDPARDAALDRLDAAHAAWIAAGGPVGASPPNASLVQATVVPLVDGADPITDIVMTERPSAHGVVTTATTAARHVQLQLVTGQAPRVDHIDAHEETLRASPDPSWGTRAGLDGLKLGVFDGAGAIHSPWTIRPESASHLAVAIGSAAEGATAWVDVSDDYEKLVFVARVRSGAIASLRSLEVSAIAYATDVDGRAILAWVTRGVHPVARAQVLEPGGDGEVVELGSVTAVPTVGSSLDAVLSYQYTMPKAACLSTHRAWISTDSGVDVVGHGTLDREVAAGELQGCAASAALLRPSFYMLSIPATNRTFTICSARCRDVVHPPIGVPVMTATVIDDQLVVVAVHRDVIGVWRTGALARFFRLPEPVVLAKRMESLEGWPVMAMTDGAVIDVIARAAAGYVIVRVPAS